MSDDGQGASVSDDHGELGRSFDAVAELYDDVRPRYPDELYDKIERVIGGWSQRRVLDLAAGTGIAARAMARRGAWVVALEPGTPMVRRLRQVSPNIPAVMAAAERLPFGADQFEVVTCATAWHWLDVASAVSEIRRVTTPGGHLALWWANHRIEAGIDWEDAQSDVYTQWQTQHGSRPPAYTGVAPRAAASDLRARGLEVVIDVTVEWTRQRSLDDHIRVLATHSDVIALGAAKQDFLDQVRTAIAPWPVVTERLAGPLVVARV